MRSEMESLLQAPRLLFRKFLWCVNVINSRNATTLKSLQVKRRTRWKQRRDPSKPRRTFRPQPFLKPGDVNPTAEWSSLYQTARAYDPYLIPVPIRMGRPGPGELPPVALGNIELLKVSH
jgi:hypothetical protein